MSVSIQRHDPYKDDMDRMNRNIGDNTFMLRQLMNEMTVRRIPERRLRNLRQSWILAFLKGEGFYKPSVEYLDWIPFDDGSKQWLCSFHTPHGVPSIPRFYILDDGTDPELLLANRLECVLCISQHSSLAPTGVLLLIEAMANAMERIALEASD